MAKILSRREGSMRRGVPSPFRKFGKIEDAWIQNGAIFCKLQNDAEEISTV